MIDVAAASIKAFRMTHRKDQESPSEDTILEIPLDEFKAILADLTTNYNKITELARITGNRDLMIARDILANRLRTLRDIGGDL